MPLKYISSTLLNRNALFPKKVKAINFNDQGEITLKMEMIRSAKGSQNIPRIIYSRNSFLVDYSYLIGFTKELCESRYFPAFRNAMNEAPDIL